MRPSRQQALAAVAADEVAIRLWQGLGDTIYFRPVVLAALALNKNVVVETAWPQLFLGLDGTYVPPPNVSLRTQRENVTAWGGKPYTGEFHYRPGYSNERLMAGQSVMEAVAASVRPLDISGISLAVNVPTWAYEKALRALQEAGWAGQHVLVVRPPTVRAEAPLQGRNAHPDAVKAAVEEFDGWFKIEVGYLAEGAEWRDAAPLDVDASFMYGEFDVLSLIALMCLADAVIVGNNCSLPLACAAQANMLVIGGGAVPTSQHIPWGHLGDAQVVCVEPDTPCFCYRRTHDCERRISDDRIRAAARRVRGKTGG